MALDMIQYKEVVFEYKKGVRKAILNRPRQLNSLTFEMIAQMLKKLRDFEEDSTVRLVIFKGNGRAFCAGGDVKGLLNLTNDGAGHWSCGASFYRRQFILDYKISTYNKPVVAILNGIVMGGGAGLSMHSTFRIVTENTIFAMPEVALGLFPECAASYFLSRTPGFFGEYLGLTGKRLDGAEMVACGLATHFVLSKDLASLEDSLESLAASGLMVDEPTIRRTINSFVHQINLKKDSVYKRLEMINQCFSKDTVEEILSSLEKRLGMEEGEEKWIKDAVNSMKSASPTSLKIFLRLIREGRRTSDLKQCLANDFRAVCHILRRTTNNDFSEGARAVLIDKQRKPQWMPSKLEQVSKEMVEKYFREVENDEDWVPLQLPASTSSNSMAFSPQDHHFSRL